MGLMKTNHSWQKWFIQRDSGKHPLSSAKHTAKEESPKAIPCTLRTTPETFSQLQTNTPLPYDNKKLKPIRHSQLIGKTPQNTAQEVITFSSVDGNWQMIHFWKALRKCFQFQYKIWKSADVSKIYSNKIVRQVWHHMTSTEFVRIRQISLATVHH